MEVTELPFEEVEAVEREEPSLCAWPGCSAPALCESGNFGDLPVCAVHFQITNGTEEAAQFGPPSIDLDEEREVAFVAGERFEAGSALYVGKDGKAYKWQLESAIDLDEEQFPPQSLPPEPQIPAATLDLVAGLRLGFAQQLGALSQVLLNARGLLANSRGLPLAAQDALAEPLNSLQAALSDAYTDLGKVMWVLRP